MHLKKEECNSLDEVRSNIDRIDDGIIRLIAERGTFVSQASRFKKNEEGVKDSSRVEKVIQKVRAKAETYGANPDMVERIYREMIAGFIKMEMKEFLKTNDLSNPEILLKNLEKIHTTPLGADRICRNLKLAGIDAVDFCKQKIASGECKISRDGKNWYCAIGDIVITVNANSYTIITAHRK